jgi:hypothetical protein
MKSSVQLIVVLVIVLFIALFLYRGEKYKGPPSLEKSDPTGSCRKANRTCDPGYFPACYDKSFQSKPTIPLDKINWVTQDSKYKVSPSTPSCWFNCKKRDSVTGCVKPDGTNASGAWFDNIYDMCNMPWASKYNKDLSDLKCPPKKKKNNSVSIK